MNRSFGNALLLVVIFEVLLTADSKNTETA